MILHTLVQRLNRPWLTNEWNAYINARQLYEQDLSDSDKRFDYLYASDILLTTLKQLRSSGLITPEEYNTARRQIMEADNVY